MKKLLTTIILILCCATLQAQPPSVAGVQFGTSYEQVKPILDKRFNGGKYSYQSEKNKLTYFNVEFAGEHFTYAEFEFQVDAFNTYLSYIAFYKFFNLSESVLAKGMRDRLFAEYCKKYPFRWERINENDYKYYVLGHDYFNSEHGFIIISVNKVEHKKGVTKLWTSIAYICNGFVNTQDEI